MLNSFKNKPQAVHWFFLILLLAAFLFINIPFLMPLTLAGVFALGLNDWIEKLSAKGRLGRKSWSLIFMLLGMCLFLIPLSLAIYRIVVYASQPKNIETDQILSQAHNLKNYAINMLQKLSDLTGTDLAGPAREVMENVLHKVGSVAIEYSTQFLGQLPAILLLIFVFLIAMTVMLIKAPGIKDFTLRYSPLKSETTEKLIVITKKSCWVTLFSTLVIGLIQASLIGAGSLIFGEGDFWLVLTVTFFVSFIPVIGAAPVGYLLCVLAFIGDRTGSAIGLFIVATIAGSIDNILKPFIVGGDQDISPVIGFTCVVGAIIMMGLPGLLIGPVIMNLFVGISPILLKET
ncbi:AI-2E family transporter [Bdellovibrio bacteriovorus]|uniref:AI-2E family transporter n=1 Tax=Bdellovibrio bacteriovorus TaxID=959 RepID=UPI003AA8929E